MNTPVCLIIFRRPGHTRRVLDAIAQVRPSKLFVVADGPRLDHPEDAEACAAARAEIDRIDWPCEVVRNYSEVNLGCGKRPCTGIDWLFEQVEEAIILEDDCVPDVSFFRYCEELLEKYRDDRRVMHISGSNYRSEDIPIADSYDFGRSPGCWGWATWRRAWVHFDLTAKAWPSLRDSDFYRDVIATEWISKEYRKGLDLAHETEGNCSFWDFQWGLACWANSGLAIFPKYNLVSNEGCGLDATHTHDLNSSVANLPRREMKFPLIHPEEVVPNRKMELYIEESDGCGASQQQGGLERSARALRKKVGAATPDALKAMLKKMFFQSS